MLFFRSFDQVKTLFTLLLVFLKSGDSSLVNQAATTIARAEYMKVFIWKVCLLNIMIIVLYSHHHQVHLQRYIGSCLSLAELALFSAEDLTALSVLRVF